MVLYKYFRPASSLSDPRGQLSAAMSPEVIKEVNVAVEKAGTSGKKGSREGVMASSHLITKQ